MARLRFVTGRANSGKSEYAYREYAEAKGEKYIFLVPDQMTLSVQKRLVEMRTDHSLYNTYVMGFNRLSYRLCDEKHKKLGTVLDETGRLLLLYKALMNISGDLKIFKNGYNKPGFLKNMISLLKEFTEFQVSTDDLLRAVSGLSDNRLINDKLMDMLYIRKEFERLKGNSYVASEDVLVEAKGYIENSDMVKGSKVIIDGFSTFTPLQLCVIEEILRTAATVTVVLDYDENDTYGLFESSKGIYERLISIAEKNSIAFETAACFERYISKTDELCFFEKNYEQRMERYGKKCENICISSCKDLTGEIEYVAGEIVRLTASGYHYRDIAVIAANADAYADIIDEKFGECNIHYFSDRRRSLFHNVAVEGMLSAIGVCINDFSYEAVFRYLKCGLFDDPGIDRLDLYVRAMGIRGISAYKKKFTDSKYIPDRFTEKDIEYLDEVKKRLLSTVKVLHKDIKAETISEQVTAVRKWMEKTGVSKILDDICDRLDKNQRTVLLSQYGQTEELINRLLDQIVEIMGGEKAGAGELYKLLEMGFGTMGVGVIPNYSDRILIGDIKRSRLTDVKFLFCIGMNDRVFPGGASEGNLLGDAERERLSDYFELNKTSLQLSRELKYYIYRSFIKAGEKLYLSYSANDENQKALYPSYVVSQIKKMFGINEIRLGKSIYHPRQGLGIIADPNDYGYSEGRLLALREYYKKSEYADFYKKISRAENIHHIVAEVITADNALALFGNQLMDKSDDIYVSVSRLESFAGCRMKHFLKYGLELKSRQEWEMKQTDIGTLYHDALWQIFSKMKEDNLTISQMREKSEELVALAVENAKQKLSAELLERDSRTAYIVEQMKSVLLKNIKIILLQLSQGDMHVKDVELSFGMEGDELKAYRLSDSRYLIRGKIDRVDCGDDLSGGEVVRIVDYKSGGTMFDPIKIGEGLQLQLLLYMSAYLKLSADEKKKRVGGAYYYHISENMVTMNEGELRDEDNRLLPEEEIRKLVDEKLIKAGRMSGPTSSDKDIISTLEKSFRNMGEGVGVESLVVDSLKTIKKTGDFSDSSKVYTEKGFNRLLDNTEKNAVKLCNSIMSGMIEPNPYIDGQNTSCSFCEYSGKCGFDTTIKGDYRRLEKTIEAGNNDE